jgi:hypothetical protein
MHFFSDENKPGATAGVSSQRRGSQKANGGVVAVWLLAVRVLRVVGRRHLQQRPSPVLVLRVALIRLQRVPLFRILRTLQLLLGQTCGCALQAVDLHPLHPLQRAAGLFLQAFILLVQPLLRSRP